MNRYQTPCLSGNIPRLYCIKCLRWFLLIGTGALIFLSASGLLEQVSESEAI